MWQAGIIVVWQAGITAMHSQAWQRPASRECNTSDRLAERRASHPRQRYFLPFAPKRQFGGATKRWRLERNETTDETLQLLQSHMSEMLSDVDRVMGRCGQKTGEMWDGVIWLFG